MVFTLCEHAPHFSINFFQLHANYFAHKRNNHNQTNPQANNETKQDERMHETKNVQRKKMKTSIEEEEEERKKE